MRGRKRLPTSLHVIRGSYRPDRHGGRDPQVPAGSDAPPEAPAWMSERQVAVWRDAVECAPRGVLRKIDRSVLTMWVVAADQHATAAAMQNALDADAAMPLLMQSEDGAPKVSSTLPVSLAREARPFQVRRGALGGGRRHGA